MWIKNVDVPPELISAAESGKLVIFVGAGASIDAPASLPSFNRLVETIGNNVACPPTEEDFSFPDIFLGKLEDSGVDVHQLVYDEINGVNSQPNKLHEALMRLATAYGSPRVVTTNYDPHLENATPCAIPVYEGPAVPLGDDFEGIVHLHGSLNQDARHLIITDTDFGSAYLRDAWAARFLDRMFSAYTVLFIGYSHGDMVMRYLARSLGSQGKRYICTHEPDKPEWKSYGLHPIAYELDKGRHRPLNAFIAHWAELATMGQLDHHQRTTQLVLSGPPTALLPEDASYLENGLDRPERLRYFVDSAKGFEWLEWVMWNPRIPELLTSESHREIAKILFSWIFRSFAMDSEYSLEAFKLASRFPWTEEIAALIAMEALGTPPEASSATRLWVTHAIKTHPHSRLRIFSHLFRAPAIRDDPSLTLTHFKHQTTPILQVYDSPLSELGLNLSLTTTGDKDLLRIAWQKHIKPLITDVIETLTYIASEHISEVYRLLEISGSPTKQLSFMRLTIEDHDGGYSRHSTDLLIDVARDCIECALTHNKTLADLYIGIWESRDEKLFQRLAIHAYSIRQDLSPDKKVTWLLGKDWLWDPFLHHEVYTLLAKTVPSCSKVVIENLLQKAQHTLTQTDFSNPDRKLYDFLEWLNRHASQQEIIRTSWEEFQRLHPKWDRKDRPDLRRTLTITEPEDHSPFSVDTLTETLLKDPSQAAYDLRQVQASSVEGLKSRWRDTLSTLRRCVSRTPESGLQLARVISDENLEIQHALINGWSAAKLSSDTASEVLMAVSNWNTDTIRSSATFMLQSVSDSNHPTAWHELPQARDLARRLWPEASIKGITAENDNDLLTEAINHPAGHLAYFWLKVVEYEWKKDEDEWQGLPADTSQVLREMLEAPGRNGILAQVVLASRLNFLIEADTKWTKENLLPLFDWNKNPDTAPVSWQGFLWGGSPRDKLLDTLFLPLYCDTCGHLQDLARDLTPRLAWHLAHITAFVSADPVQDLTHFIRKSPGNLTVNWIHEIRGILLQMAPERIVHQWKRWIQAYWSNRVRTIPRKLSKEEGIAMASWLPYLQPVLPEVVPLFLKTDTCLEAESGLLLDFEDCDLRQYPDEWIMILTHILRGTKSTSWEIRQSVPRLFSILREIRDESSLEPLLKEALRLGIPLPDLRSKNAPSTNP